MKGNLMKTSYIKSNTNFNAYGDLIHDNLDAVIKDLVPELRCFDRNIADLTSRRYFDEMSSGRYYIYPMVTRYEEELMNALLQGIISSAIKTHSISSGNLIFGAPSSLSLTSSSLDVNVETNEFKSCNVVFSIETETNKRGLALVIDAESGLVEEITMSRLIQKLYSIKDYNDELSIDEIISLVSIRLKLSIDEVIDKTNGLYHSFRLSDNAKDRHLLAELGLLLMVEEQGVEIHELSEVFKNDSLSFEADFEIMTNSSDDQFDELHLNDDMSHIHVDRNMRYRVYIIRHGVEFSFGSYILNEAIQVRDKTLEFYRMNGRLPAGNEELGL